MKEIRASAEGYIADGSIQMAAIDRNQAAIQRAIYKLNPGNRNGGGGRLIIDDSGYGLVRGGFDVCSGLTIEGGGSMGTTLMQAPGSNVSMWATHRWDGTPTGSPNAQRVRIIGMTIDCNQRNQGTRIADATIVAGQTPISSPSYRWTVGERLAGSGILPDTTIVSVAPDDADGRHWATLSAPAQQSLYPAVLFGGVSVPLCGILASTNPRTDVGGSKDWTFDPTDSFEDVEIRNARDAGVIISGRSGIWLTRILVHVPLVLGVVTSFDTHLTDVQVLRAGWGGVRYDGSSCHSSNCKVYNVGQNQTTPGALPNLGYGYKAPLTLSEWAACEAQQCSGTAFDLAGSHGHALAGVVAAQVGYGRDGVGAYGFDLSGAQADVVVGTFSGLGGSWGVRMPPGAVGNKVMVGSMAPVLLSPDSSPVGNAVY